MSVITSTPTTTIVSPNPGGSGRKRTAIVSTANPSSNRNTNRYSVKELYSLAAEQDTEIEDELARGKLIPKGRKRRKEKRCHL
jgi:hypothetical protein